MIFDGCLIATDLDGTLIENGEIPKRNVDAIDYFISNGGKFCFATGRTVMALSCVGELLDKVCPSVLANGGLIYDFSKKKALWQCTLTEKDKSVIKYIKEKCGSVGIEIHTEDATLVFNRSAETDDHEYYESLVPTFCDFDTVLKSNCNKALYAFADEKEEKAVKAAVAECDFDCKFVDTSCIIGDRKRRYLEQIPNGISKAYGVLKLAEMLNIKKGCIFAVGDYYNDFEMLKAADVAATVSGAPDDIKEICDFVGCAAKDGAVADFIDYLKNYLERK